MNNSHDLEKYQFLDSIEGASAFEEAGSLPWSERLKTYSAGVVACFIVTLAAQFVAYHYTVPVMLIALLMGMSMNFLSQDAPTKIGVHFTSQSVLRLGVVLIGARIAFDDFFALGISGVTFVVCATAFVIFMSLFLARIFNIGKEQGILVGGATAICGASAALAISSVLPPSKDLERNTLLAVLGVTAMGTLAMIVYPIVISLFGYDDGQAGVLIGGTIHDVSQVVGAGYSISTEAGDVAVVVKLLRVFLLIPVLLIVACVFKQSTGGNKTLKKMPLPFFLVGFFVLMLLNSFSLLPYELVVGLEYCSKWCLIMAITAVGMKTSLKTVLSLGMKTFLLVLLNTLCIAVLYFSVIAFDIF